MTAHNRHLLAEGAYRANREAAAREQQAKDAALLRDMAADASKECASWHGSASLMETYGHHAAAEADRREADTLSRIAAALRDAADRIEAGEA